jgi:RNA polymerase sigma-70 factor (ECF subfamily)
MNPDFAQAYDNHVHQVYAFLAYRVGSRGDAEDLTQLTFERALRAWDRFDPRRASARTWLLAIARNALIDDHRRRHGVVNEPLDALEEERLGPAAGELPPELTVAAELWSALESLSDRDRELVALRYAADMTGPEIAELMELELANVQQILSRSLRKLRAHLEEQGVGPVG